MADFRKRGKIWYFRFIDADGVRRTRKGCTDKRATEELARAAETEAARIKAGLLDPKTLALKAHEARPLVDHLNDWRAYLISQGNTVKHADLYTDRARRVFALVCGASLAEIDPPKASTKADRDRATKRTDVTLKLGRLSDLNPTRVQDALATLKGGGRSLATCNHHRGAVRAFSRWAWHDGRMQDDALVGVTGFNAATDRRHDRRTLSLAELQNLVTAAERGPVYQKMTGPDRALCYRLAVATGLRYSEIKSIVPGSLDLQGEAPTVTVAASYTKNGKPAVLPLPRDVADDLAAYMAGMPPDAPLFPLPAKGAKMLRVDLKAAGIPYRDSAGLVFDFHALRCQMATLLDGAGVSPRVVQTLMRHSTLELTGRYTRPRMHDLEGATDSLPPLRPTEAPDGELVAATGTDGQRIEKLFGPHLALQGDGTGRIGADAGVITPSNNVLPMDRKSLPGTGVDVSVRVLPGTDGTSGDWIRTSDLRVMNPLLWTN